jgi:NADH:ubiquinone oxidoreductase subunit 5 (subunit L)/multisubunit Na+/H+ antiporter MnhA subunit
MSKWFMIHAMSNEQDMCKMGGLASLLPFTYGLLIKTLVCLHKVFCLILDGCKL